MKFNKIINSSLMSLLILGTFGCAETTSQRVVWPMPPEQERLEWIGTYQSIADFGLRNFLCITANPGNQDINQPYDYMWCFQLLMLNK